MSIINSLISHFSSFLQSALYVLPISLVSLTIHEYAHGFVAYKLGDPTAKEEGRLSLNPLKHLDPIGFIFMLFFRVGYAKPVPVNPMYFKNPKKGMLLTAAVGPLSNFVLGVVCSFFTALIFVLSDFVYSGTVMDILFEIFYIATLLNISLAVFNLIPVHPFDGSRILGYFLPNSYHRFVYKYGTYIYIAFFVFLLSTDYVEIFIGTVQQFLTGWLWYLWQYPVAFIVKLFM